MKGRPRKPTWVLEASGAYAKNPQRRKARAGEPTANGPIGQPPAYFNEIQASIWNEFVAECAEGVLTKADRKHLELTVRLMTKMRFQASKLTLWFTYLKRALLAKGMDEEAVDGLCTAMEKMLDMSASEVAVLMSCLQQMGMTPKAKLNVSTS